MKKNTLLIIATILASGMSACSDKSNVIQTETETKELPIIEMVSTHAIDLDISVSKLTFVPNSAAAWLGRVILLSDEGYLYSTDIEGRDPKPVGKSKYIDIFGLARETAPGVFLAITEDNKIEAFIESDNVGNFSPMIYSGAEIAIQTFCPKTGTVNNRILVRTLAGEHKILMLNIASNNVVQLASDAIVFPNQPPSCLTQYATIGHNQGNFNVIKGKTSGLYMYQIAPLDQEYNVSIKNGLSVRGVNHVKYVTSTRKNYGGGAYAKGVLALVDADEKRVVFISLSYAEQKLFKAINPAEEASQ